VQSRRLQGAQVMEYAAELIWIKKAIENI